MILTKKFPNKTVGYRSFGEFPENIIPFSNSFIQTTQQHGIIATAKHFPGHGLVSGDTHKSLQVIDGELKEIKKTYMIDNIDDSDSDLEVYSDNESETETEYM